MDNEEEPQAQDSLIASICCLVIPRISPFIPTCLSSSALSLSYLSSSASSVYSYFYPFHVTSYPYLRVIPCL